MTSQQMITAALESHDLDGVTYAASLKARQLFADAALRRSIAAHVRATVRVESQLTMAQTLGTWALVAIAAAASALYFSAPARADTFDSAFSEIDSEDLPHGWFYYAAHVKSNGGSKCQVYKVGKATSIGLMTFVYNRQPDKYYLSLVNPSWKLTAGREYKAELFWPNGATDTVKARAQTNKGGGAASLLLDINNVAGIATRFSESVHVEVAINGQSLGRISLLGSRKATNTWNGCIRGAIVVVALQRENLTSEYLTLSKAQKMEVQRSFIETRGTFPAWFKARDSAPVTPRGDTFDAVIRSE